LPTATVSLEAKQAWLAAWNAFPLLVSLAHVILSAVGTTVFSQAKYTAYAKKSTISSTRMIYAFAFGLATITQVASWSVSMSSLLFPTLYSPDILPHLHPVKVFLPILSHAATEWPLGMHRLLQWDNFVGSTALLAWAAMLWSNAYRVKGVKSNVPLALKLIGLSATSGFSGAAAVLLWERDELLLAGDDIILKKRTN
jgi:hypothetical protein